MPFTEKEKAFYKFWKSDLSKTRILSSSNYVDTTVWWHHLDSNETHGEKATWKLYKDAASWFEQIQEASKINVKYNS